MLNRRVDTDLFGAKEQSINSKVKGNNNELKAAKWLTKWTGCPFTRTPSSGGLRWRKIQEEVQGNRVRRCTRRGVRRDRD